MEWIEEQKEKFLVASSLLITVIIDLFLVIAVSSLLELSKYVLETYIFKQKLTNVDLLPFRWIYTISKVVIISGFIIYAIKDIISHIITTYKKLKDE
jgi:hypothetical protein